MRGTVNQADRISELATLARKAGAWIAADEALALRVEDAAPNLPPSPARAEFVSLASLSGTGRPSVRSGGDVSGDVAQEVYASFDDGEIACAVESGGVLGEWIVRGTVWLRGDDKAAWLEWVADDHVLASRRVIDTEPFRLDEVSTVPWHLELTCGPRTYRLDDIGR